MATDKEIFIKMEKRYEQIRGTRPIEPNFYDIALECMALAREDTLKSVVLNPEQIAFVDRKIIERIESVHEEAYKLGRKEADEEIKILKNELELEHFACHKYLDIIAKYEKLLTEAIPKVSDLIIREKMQQMLDGVGD